MITYGSSSEGAASFSSKERSVGRGLERELLPAVVLELSVCEVEGESRDTI
jgi:hypothetical protein